jgi:UTP--glucose-1-phosphate uridylyltransferase
LIQVYEETGCSVLATLHDPPEINRYGVISIAADGRHVTDIVEKPAVGSEPSREASIGRFLYTSEIYEHLEAGLRHHGGGEYFHTPALKALAARGRLVYHRTEGERLDIGAPAGYLKAILRYAGARPDLLEVIRSRLQ